jgi:4,4'-diaponeurosporenoate glycosyltransferase
VGTVTVVLVVAGLVAGAYLLARIPLLRPGRRADAWVSVIVPARNEAATLPKLLASLASLDPAPAEVIVVDDGSTDGTGQIAAAAGVAVVEAPEPPVGWLGKPWACNAGATGAIGTHLLFLDADTWLAPDALGRLAAEHATRGGLVSVQPYHRMVKPYEELSAVCSMVAMMGTRAFTPRADGHAGAAFGPCIFTSADDYWAVGGHVAVAGEVLDDLRLAQRYRQAGRPVTCFGGGSTVAFRMYPGGLGQLVAGWSKGLAAGALAARRLAVLATLVWVAALAAASISLGFGLLAWATGDELPLVALALYALVALEVGWMARRIGTFRWWTIVLFPLPLLAFVVIFVRSCIETLGRRSVRWRGRTVPVHPWGG